MDEQLGVGLSGSAQGELEVGPVHGIAGVERHHALPAKTLELTTQLGRSAPEVGKVNVREGLEHLELSGGVPGIGAVQEVTDARVSFVCGTEDRRSLSPQIGLPGLCQMESGNHHSLRITQCERPGALRRLDHILRQVEHDGDGPQGAIGQSHGLAHCRVVVGTEESSQRRKPSVREQL
ncbi:MAG: hypothetical protein WKF82_11360 [Nocardioidaceae bacterium]